MTKEVEGNIRIGDLADARLSVMPQLRLPFPQLWQLGRPRHPQIEFAYSSRFTSRRQEILTDKTPLAGFASRLLSD